MPVPLVLADLEDGSKTSQHLGHLTDFIGESPSMDDEGQRAVRLEAVASLSCWSSEPGEKSQRLAGQWSKLHAEAEALGGREDLGITTQ